MHLRGREKIAENFGEKLSLVSTGSGARGAAGGDEGGGETAETDKTDMTDGAQVVLRIITRLSELEKPVTLLLLAELWKGTGQQFAGWG